MEATIYQVSVMEVQPRGDLDHVVRLEPLKFALNSQAAIRWISYRLTAAKVQHASMPDLSVTNCYPLDTGNHIHVIVTTISRNLKRAS